MSEAILIITGTLIGFSLIVKWWLFPARRNETLDRNLSRVDRILEIEEIVRTYQAYHYRLIERNGLWYGYFYFKNPEIGGLTDGVSDIEKAIELTKKAIDRELERR